MQTKSRLFYLDWLRIMAIFGVLVFHSGLAFSSEWDWHIKNQETSALIMEFNFWLSKFRMPLLFFISGCVTFTMLRKQSGSTFVKSRFKRLFIPLLFGMLIIVPPQIYMERLTQGYKGSYLDFYASVFNFEPYPAGSFSWHHLWFIFYLFLYNLMLTPVFKWLLGEKGKRVMQAMQWLGHGKRIYLLLLPSMIIFASLILRFPPTNDLINDWCHFFYWLSFLVAGFLCIAIPGVMDSLERNRRFSLALGLLSIILVNYLRWNNQEPGRDASVALYGYLAMYPVIAWGWLLAAIGYGKKYLNKPHPVLNYLNNAAYPFYILHQTVIIIIVYYVVQTKETTGMKYIFTIIVSLLLSWLIYHLFIRPYRITCFLFGMKGAKKSGEKEVVVAPSPVLLNPVA